MVGGGAALAFAIALLASGLSSSSVGTYAGQVVMQGFIGRSVPLFLRRALTMLLALIVLGAGLPPTTCLVISQVVLSFGVPFALVPLVALTRRADVMGALVNRRPDHARGRRRGRPDHRDERLPARDRAVATSARHFEGVVGRTKFANRYILADAQLTGYEFGSYNDRIHTQSRPGQE